MVEKEDELFRPILRGIFEDTQGRLGAKNIRATMITQRYAINPERISRLMKEMGLVCASAQKGPRYNFVPKGRHITIGLNENFSRNIRTLYESAILLCCM